MSSLKSRSLLTFSWGQGVFLCAILTLDLLSKNWASTHLFPYQPYLGFPFGGIGVFESRCITFSLVLTLNRGGAFSLLSAFPNLLLVLRIAVIGALFVYLLSASSRPYKWSLTWIFSGALANIVDYLWHGGVIDFLCWTFGSYTYPIFNVADIAICLGVFFLLIQMVFKKGPLHERRK